jgi:hypothetical protein
VAEKAINGFIIDTPNILIQTSQGDAHIVTAKNGEVKFGGESLTLQGGWSFYDLAEIDTKKTIEINITQAQWGIDYMKLVSGGTRTQAADERYYFGTPYTISSNTITIPYAIVSGSLKINGFTEVTTTPAAEKEFKVTITTGTPGSSLVTFYTGVSGTIYPAFKVATPATTESLVVKTTDFPKAGSVILQFPIYSDADSTDSTITGYGQIVIYKAKMLSDFGFAGAYKSASEFTLNLKGLDPRRTDGAMWKFSYLPA